MTAAPFMPTLSLLRAVMPAPTSRPECGRRVCAWCQPQRDLGPAPGLAAGKVTHGVCPECFERQMAELNLSPKET